MKLQALESGVWHAYKENSAGKSRLISLRTNDRVTAEGLAAALEELSNSVTATVTPSVTKVFQDWLEEKIPRSARQRSIFIARPRMVFCSS